jgi:hypothetical protein
MIAAALCKDLKTEIWKKIRRKKLRMILWVEIQIQVNKTAKWSRSPATLQFNSGLLGGGGLGGGSLLSGGGLSGGGFGGGSLGGGGLSGSGLSNWGSYCDRPESVGAGAVGSRGVDWGSRSVDDRGRGVGNWGRGGNNHWGRGVGRDNNGGRGVGGGGGGSVSGGGGLVGGLLGVVGLSLVPDVSHVSGLVSLVGHNLDAAVGKVDAVLSGGVVVVAVLGVREDGAVVIVGDTVVEGVVGRDDGVSDHDRGSVGWRGRSVDLGHAGGAGQESGRESDLQREIVKFCSDVDFRNAEREHVRLCS